MNTIITHDKKQWGRSSKHKRVDLELEKELNSFEKTQSKKNATHGEVISQISEYVAVGGIIVVQTNNTITPSNEIMSDNAVISGLNLEYEIDNVVDESPLIKTIDGEITFIEDIEGFEEKIRMLGDVISDVKMIDLDKLYPICETTKNQKTTKN